MTTELTKLWHIDSINLFDGISFEDKKKIETLTNTRKLNKHEYVFFPDDPSKDIHFLASGRIKVGKHSPNGKENIKAIIYEGEMFGELSLLEKNPDAKREDFAMAMDEDTIICSIPQENMAKLLQEHPVLNEKVMKQITKRLKRTEKRMEALMFKDARTRLIDFIKELAQDLGKPIGHEILVKHRLTHQEIASITAISRQKVTTLLNELKNENLIHLERKSLLIRDISILK
ncbi:MAG: Crp/Fnr family transcriptional regulator [Lishizhenia sp.]